MIFKKGDYIRYAGSGVCLIDDIKNMKYTKTPEEFYVLKPISAASSTIYVPTANEVLTAKMRYILNKDDIDSLILSISETEICWIDDRKKRTEEFRRVIKECNPKELLELVSCIYLKKQQLSDAGKKLTSTDESLLAQAESLIENEFSFVLGLNGSEVGEYIRSKLGI